MRVRVHAQSTPRSFLPAMTSPLVQLLAIPLKEMELADGHTQSTATREPSPYDRHVADNFLLRSLSFSWPMASDLVAEFAKLATLVPEEDCGVEFKQVLNFVNMGESVYVDESSVTSAFEKNVGTPSCQASTLALFEDCWDHTYSARGEGIHTLFVLQPSPQSDTKADRLVILSPRAEGFHLRDRGISKPPGGACVAAIECKNLFAGSSLTVAAVLFHVYWSQRTGELFPWFLDDKKARRCTSCDGFQEAHKNAVAWQGPQCVDAEYAGKFKPGLSIPRTCVRPPLTPDRQLPRTLAFWMAYAGSS